MLGALGGRAPVLSQIVGMAAEQVRNLGLDQPGQDSRTSDRSIAMMLPSGASCGPSRCSEAACRHQRRMSIGGDGRICLNFGTPRQERRGHPYYELRAAAIEAEGRRLG